LVLDETKSTYYKKRQPKDGELDFSWDDKKIYNYVRALTRPYPGAFFHYKGKTIIVWEAKLSNETTSEPVGSFSINPNNQSLLVSTGNNKLISLYRIQIEGMPECFGHEMFSMVNSNCKCTT